MSGQSYLYLGMSSRLHTRSTWVDRSAERSERGRSVILSRSSMSAGHYCIRLSMSGMVLW